MKVQVPADEAAADILEAAAEHIKAGWTQGQPFEIVDGRTYCCANGALWLALGLSAENWNGETTDSQRELWGLAYRKLSDHVGDAVASWNDSIGQTQGRVANTMLQLAGELRGPYAERQHLDM
jgi:hypothetical protein